MSQTFIISDLHLSGQRPGTIELFFRFLEEQPTPGDQLYILGDLFDAWIGDDDATPPIPQIKEKMLTTSQRGIEIAFIHGNRDFLVGETFAQETGSTLLNEVTVTDINSTPTLLMHGDLLCTDDVEYMKARAFLRNPAFIADIMTKSIPERLAMAAEFRKRSGEANSLKAADIMDVNQQTVEQTMRDHNTLLLIHGHTHRPNTHHFELDGQPAKRIVLAEWHEELGNYLKITNGEIQVHDFPAS
ncbi:MAG: UDP-2,3-diacylglucosamine diphosphatase [Chromatiales bacterium]|nr:UDP-2,3-diacylglucosamine diphosphatase [Chromatiales bacterium]